MVLLAGGFGTRIAHLTEGLPKPMVEVAGRPFIEWLMVYYGTFGIADFILSTGYRSEIVEKYFRQRSLPGVKVRCQKESVPLGTAGAFLNATSGFADPSNGWLIANGDSLIAANPTLLVEFGQKHGWDAALFGLEVVDATRFGTLKLSKEGLLESFSEKRTGSGLINAGVYWLSRDCRAKFPSKRPLSFETDVFPELLVKGMRIGVLPVSVPFIDIGTPATLEQANDFVIDVAKRRDKVIKVD